jgi:Phage P22-like portal protein
MALDDMGDPSDVSDEGLSTDEEILEEAKQRYRMCVEYEQEITEQARKDLNYISGNQWDTEIKNQREQDSRPCLTINRLNPFINQVKNDLIQNQPSINVRPVDNKDTATADVINGLIRHIINNVDGKSALDTALGYAVKCGIGYLRVKSAYLYDDSFDQELCLERIEDPLLVHFPLPLCKMQDYSDAPYCVIRTLISKRDYKELYPDKWDDFQAWETQTSESQGEYWVTKESVWLAEYFKIEKKKKTIYLLSDGTTSDTDKDLPVGQDGIPLTVVKERETEDRKTMRYLLSGASILEKTEIPCKYIPIVPVFGDELIVEGKKHYISLIRFVRDIQMMYNVLKSKEIELIMLSTKAQFMAAKGQVPPNLMNDWKASNIKNTPILFYEADPIGSGQAMSPPQPIQYREIDMATVNASKETIDDIKSITGIHDASLGAAGNETSGKAIIARQRQGDTANSHFYESFVRALRHIGRILIDMIPQIYDTPRTIRIVGEDLTDKVVSVNQMYPDPETGTLYNIAQVGRYAVTVQTGPTYESRRQDTAQGIISLVQANPQLFGLLGDILVQNLDWVGSDRATRRIQATMDPKILAADSEGQSGDINQMQAVKAQLMMLQQKSQQDEMQKQQMGQLIQTLSEQIKQKQIEQQGQLATAQIRSQTEIDKAKIGLQQEQIRQHAGYVKHAVDTAININPGLAQPEQPLSPAPGQQPGNTGASQPSYGM